MSDMWFGFFFMSKCFRARCDRKRKVFNTLHELKNKYVLSNIQKHTPAQLNVFARLSSRGTEAKFRMVTWFSISQSVIHLSVQTHTQHPLTYRLAEQYSPIAPNLFSQVGIFVLRTHARLKLILSIKSLLQASWNRRVRVFFKIEKI